MDIKGGANQYNSVSEMVKDLSNPEFYKEFKNRIELKEAVIEILSSNLTLTLNDIEHILEDNKVNYTQDEFKTVVDNLNEAGILEYRLGKRIVGAGPNLNRPDF